MWNLSHYIFQPELNGWKENPLNCNSERIKKKQYDYGLKTPSLITSLVMKQCLLAMIFLFSLNPKDFLCVIALEVTALRHDTFL